MGTCFWDLSQRLGGDADTARAQIRRHRHNAHVPGAAPLSEGREGIWPLLPHRHDRLAVSRQALEPFVRVLVDELAFHDDRRLGDELAL